MGSIPAIIPVVLCGGSGTRLWPLSREGYPKQFLRLAGEQTLLQATLMRLAEIPSVAPPFLITNSAHRFLVAEQVREITACKPKIVLESHARNTAPAIAAAALLASQEGEDPILLVVPSDHVIGDTAAFVEAVLGGVQSAEEGALVTFGVVPTEASTGFGYVRASGAQVGQRVLDVERFIEKPSIEKARELVAQKNHYWNSGIFLFRASTYLAELGRLEPSMLSAVREAVGRGQADLDFFRLDADALQRCPSNSIDYAVMEHTSRAKIVPLAAEWSDVGSWDAVWQINEKCEDGNVQVGDVITQDAHDCLVHASHRLVAVAGLSNVMVVETADAVLVVNRSSSQAVKSIVEQIRLQQRTEADENRKIYRPWGSFDAIDSGTRYQVKRITVNPGGKLSLQMHHHRAEHWIVVSGTARVRNGEVSTLLTENQSIYIPIGEVHSLENPGRIPLELIEVQSGAYLGEDDIVRLQDIYGRH